MATIDLGKLKFSFEGDWDPNITYEVGDTVQHGGKIWYCKKSYSPNSHETFAPGDKGQGYKNYKTLWNLRSKFSGHLETDEDINAYHSFDDTSNFPYNYRPVDNNHQVERVDIGAGVMKYYIDSIKTPETLGIDENGMDVSFAEMGYYSFHQNGPAEKGYPLDFSITADGTHNSGVSLWTSGDDSPLKYFLNNKEVTQAHYEATLNTTSSTYQDIENLNRKVELHVPVGYEKIYPFSKTTAAMYDSKGIHVNKGWIGHEYWDLMSMGGINYRGDYDASTQYYWGDIVSMKSQESSNTSGFYRALRDNVGAPPYMTKEMNRTRSDLMADAATTSGRSKDAMGKYSPIQSWHNSWEQISGGNSNDQAAIWASNMGRIAWKYKEPLNNPGTGIYRNRTFIDKNGCVYSLGYGSSSTPHTTRPLSYFSEVDFVFRDWNESGDKSHFGHNDPSIKGFSSNGRHTNRADKRRTPKCVQICQGYDWKYFLFDNGEVQHKGYGGHGQAGHGQFSDHWMPQVGQNLRGVFIVKIAANSGPTETNNHACMALDDKGQVWTWGYNGNGELGRGRTEHWGSPFKIPQEYFENKRVIDIACSGHSSTMVARTQDDHLYGWGYNGVGQLGQSNTTNHYRPVKIGGGGSATNQWDPAVDGMACWQIAGYSGNTSIWILDNNGYIWHSGYNGYGNSGGSDTTNHQDGWVKMTSAPGGDIVDIWGISWNSYVGLFIRTKNGDTYHAGASNGNYLGLDGATGSDYPPSLITKIKNLKDIGTCGTHSDVGHTWALTDSGEFLGQGYDSYNEGGNPYAGSNWTGEDGTYKPYHKYIPAGTKISHVIPQGIYQSTNYFGNMPWVITEDGQILLWGFSGYSSNEGNHLNGHNSWCYNSNNNGLMSNPGMGR